MTPLTGPHTITGESPVVKRRMCPAVWFSPRHAVKRILGDSLLRNSAFIMLTTIANSVLGYGFWLLSARLLPPSVVGLSAALISAATLVALLASVGVGTTLVQSLPENPTTADWSLVFWTGMSTAAVTSLVGGCVILIILPIASGRFEVLREPIYAAAFLILAATWASGFVIDATFIAKRRAGNMLLRDTAVSIGKLGLLVVGTLAVAHDILPIVGAWAGASVLGTVVGVALLLRLVGRFPYPHVSALLRSASSLRSRLIANQLSGIGTQIPWYVVPLLVTARLSAASNAYFYVTWMMCGVFLIISPAVATSLFAEGVHAPAAIRDKTRRTALLVTALLGPCMVGFLLEGGRLLGTFGPAYQHHGLLLMQLVVLSAVPDAITNIYVAVLRVEGRLAEVAWLNLLMGAGTVSLVWVLLPHLGISAVGWSWMVMQVAGCVYVAVDLRRHGWTGTLPLTAVGSR